MPLFFSHSFRYSYFFSLLKRACDEYTLLFSVRYVVRCAWQLYDYTIKSLRAYTHFDVNTLSDAFEVVILKRIEMKIVLNRCTFRNCKQSRKIHWNVSNGNSVNLSAETHLKWSSYRYLRAATQPTLWNCVILIFHFHFHYVCVESCEIDAKLLFHQSFETSKSSHHSICCLLNVVDGVAHKNDNTSEK